MLCTIGRPEQSLGSSSELRRPRRSPANCLRARPGSLRAEIDSALAIFMAHYEAHSLDVTRAYPGVEGALVALSGQPMAVLTNKPTKASLEILNGLGLAKYFNFIYGGDSFETRNPIPRERFYILKELSVAPERAAMIGDSDVDIQTARNAGLQAVAVNYGFGTYNRLANPADFYLDNLTEIVPF